MVKQCAAPGCGKSFEPWRTTQRTCPTPECALAYAREKELKKRQRAQRAADRKRKERLRSKSEWVALCQKAFNRFIRARDHGRPCISCGVDAATIEDEQQWRQGGSWDCGHYRSRGAAPQLRFYVFNAARQCKACNAGEKKAQTFGTKGKPEIREAYRDNLIQRFSLEIVQRVEKMNHTAHFNIAWLRRATKIFNRRARFYEKRISSTSGG